MIDHQELENFESYLINRGLGKLTIKRYLWFYEKFEGMENLNVNYIDRFLGSYRNRPLARAFLNNYQEFLERSDETFRRIPIPRMTGTRPVRIPKVLYENQIMDIEDVMKSERDKLLLLLSFYCGLRLSGLMNIKPYDFNWDKWMPKQGEPGELRVIEKGEKERIVLVPARLMKRVRVWISEVASKRDTDPNNSIFGISNRRWGQILGRSSSIALSFSVNPHLLRHSYATYLLDRGFDLLDIKELLGHKSIETTQIYTHINKDKLKEKFSSLENL